MPSRCYERAPFVQPTDKGDVVANTRIMIVVPSMTGQAVMDERSLVLLRRKLEALNYTEALDASTAPLVSHIVNDLIRTTDSYRSVKQQASKYAQEIATFNTKASCLQQ